MKSKRNGSYIEKVTRMLRRPGVRLRHFDSGVREEIYGARHTLSYFRHLARGNRIHRRAFFDTLDDSRPPVLLIHGYLGTRGSMYIMERRLNDDGICVFSFNLGSLNVRDIRTSAFLIHRKIESILAQTPVRKIDIIGHSMGGLIGLYYVKKLGGHEKVRKLVMMGTPVRGTWAALLGIATVGLISTSAWQLLPGSRFLNDWRSAPCRAPSNTTPSRPSATGLPPVSTPLDGAQSLTVPLGHSSLVLSEEVYRHVLWALRK